MVIQAFMFMHYNSSFLHNHKTSEVNEKAAWAKMNLVCPNVQID